MIDRFMRFGAVGATGFAIDAGTLIVLTQAFAITALPARIISFLVAASVTFLLNWRFTFRRTDAFRFDRLLHYWVVTAAGALVNIGIYRFWLNNTDTTTANLVLGTALGSLTAMALNYFVSVHFVFGRGAGAR